MIDLEHDIWLQLEGPHGVLFNPAIPLKKLIAAEDSKEVNDALTELWQGIHHEGRVGHASYLAVPQLIHIAQEKKIFNWLILYIASTVEQRRHYDYNPELPVTIVKYYNRGLDELKVYILSNMNNPEHNKLTQTTALAAIATCNGQPKLGKAIQELNDSHILEEFLLDFK